jgi:hypothetical protein
VAESANPLRAAMDARDPEMVATALADDAVLHSPILSVPFRGREEISDVFAVVYEVLGEVEYLIDVPGDPHLFVWRSDVDGEPLEGVDMFRVDDRGKITEVTVIMRPLRGVAAFLDASATGWAQRRALGARGIAMHAGTKPLVAMMRLMASRAPKMTGLSARPRD